MKLRYIKPETEIVRVCTDGDVMQLAGASKNNLPGGNTDVELDDDEDELELNSKGYGSFWDDDFDY